MDMYDWCKEEEDNKYSCHAGLSSSHVFQTSNICFRRDGRVVSKEHDLIETTRELAGLLMQLEC